MKTGERKEFSRWPIVRKRVHFLAVPEAVEGRGPAFALGYVFRPKPLAEPQHAVRRPSPNHQPLKIPRKTIDGAH